MNRISIGPGTLVMVADLCIVKLIEKDVTAISSTCGYSTATFPSVADAQKRFNELVTELQPHGFFAVSTIGPLFAGRRICSTRHQTEGVGCCWTRRKECGYVYFLDATVYYRWQFNDVDACTAWLDYIIAAAKSCSAATATQ